MVNRVIESASDEDKVTFLDTHILGEFRLLLESMEVNDVFSKYPPKDRMRDLGLACSYEALLAHMRVLYDFFTDKYKNNLRYEDEVVASDYIDEWQTMAAPTVCSLTKIWKQQSIGIVTSIEEHINKRLMHLSFYRYRHLGYPLFDPIEHLKLLIKLFIENLPDRYSTPKVKGFLTDYDVRLRPIVQNLQWSDFVEGDS